MSVDRRGALRAVAGLFFGVILALLTPAAPASAHAALVGSDPANGTVVPDAPNRVTLTFSESVQLLSGKIQVISPDGTRADQGDPTSNGSAITIPLRSGGGRGTYLVSYRVISADSHPVAGSLTYSVGAASAPPSEDAIPETIDPVVQVLIPIGKYIGYAGLVLLVGPVLVLALLWPHRLSRVGPAKLVWTGLGMIAGSTLIGLWLQGPYATGTGLFGASIDDFKEVLGSTYGAVMLVRLGVICAAAFLLKPLLRGEGGESKADLALLGVLGVALMATWPLTGHPTASPVAGVSVVVDAVHLASMSVWVGGLVMLVAFLLPRADERELGAILPIWSRWAFSAVGALVVAGVVQALMEVGSFSAFFSSLYGQLIVVKVILVSGAVGAANASRVQVARKLAASNPRPLRTAVLTEIACLVAVLGVTSALVNVPPPRTAQAAETGQTATTVTQTLRNDTMSLRVDVFPAGVGNNSIHLYAYTLDNKPLPVVEWTATAGLASANIEPIEVPLLRITDIHAVGDIALPQAGTWTFKFTVRTSDIDRSTLTMEVKVT